MHFPNLLASLDRFAHLLPVVVRDVPDNDIRWKPVSGAWSILEIVGHLADEEEFDFRERVRLTLADPSHPWPPIDPEGWAVERRYNEQQLAAVIARFSKLRDESLGWLRSLEQPDWDRTHQHPQHGPFRAGDILAAWVAHDYLHLRQISKRLCELAARDAGDYSVRYAGPWGN
jgi:hypothetical protein